MSDAALNIAPGQARVALCSPDGRVRLAFFLKGCRDDSGIARGFPLWQICYDGREMLAPSPLGMAATGGPPEADDGAVELIGVTRRRGASAGRAAQDGAAPARSCREAVIRLRARGWSPGRFDLRMRCCNQGVAIRYHLLRQPGYPAHARADERAEFLFPQGTEGYLAPAGTSAYRRAPLGASSARTAFPLTLVYPHGKLGCLLEVRREGDAPARLMPIDCGFRMQASDSAPFRLPAFLPWRALIVADCPVDLPMRRDFTRALVAPGTASRGFCRMQSPADSRDHCTWPFVGYPADLLPDLAAGHVADAPCTRTHRLALPLMTGNFVAPSSEPMRDLIETLPDAWDETRFLRGEIGEYVVVARRSGVCWFVAGLTGADGRTLTVRLEDFLGSEPGDSIYRLHVWRDPLGGENAAGTDMVRETFDGRVAQDKVRLALAPHGGFVMRLEPQTRGVRKGR